MSATDELFEEGVPLAARMRPRSFDEFFGQPHLVAPEAGFRRAAEAGKLGSAILWGPPGVGKTTLADLVAQASQSHFERMSAVAAGVADLRRVVDEARTRRRPHPSKAGSLFSEPTGTPQRTLLFIDEIHRFNKGQQDAILPHVESGLITLIGATTENPSFEVNAAILSRCRVFVLKALSDVEIRQVIDRAVSDSERGLGRTPILVDNEATKAMVGLANGDARSALNLLELCASLAAASGPPPLTIDLGIVESCTQRRLLLYDKGGEQHFDLISALHKSVRGSDPDASMYWLARMLEAGEDPMYLARRIVRMATEDIGLADPTALPLCMAAQQAIHFIGMPEGALALAEAVTYLAMAPKSNALYTAYGTVVEDIAVSRADPVPEHLRNAPTKLMKDLGYGQGYRYAHDYEDAIVAQQNLPNSIRDRRYYVPTSRGFEAEIKRRMDAIRQAWSAAQSSKASDIDEPSG